MTANKITGLAAAAAMALLAGTALAKDDFPSKAIHVIVPYPAGGIVDIVARSVTDQIGRDWNQSVIVEAKRDSPVKARPRTDG